MEYSFKIGEPSLISKNYKLEEEQWDQISKLAGKIWTGLSWRKKIRS